MLRSTYCRHTSSFAVIPSTQWIRNVLAALMNIVCDSKMHAAITGSNTLSCSCPPSAAIETVRSELITRKQTMLTTSGITGLTLPGMIDEPGCFGGRLISRNPHRGPDESSRKSLQTFDSLMARLFMHEE